MPHRDTAHSIRLGWVWALALLCGGLAGSAQAHTRSESQSSWQLDGTQLSAQVLIPDTEVRRLAAQEGDLVPEARLLRYVSEHLAATANGQPCTPSQPARALPASPGYHRAELHWACPNAGPVDLQVSLFFAQVRSHLHLARVAHGPSQFAEHLLRVDEQHILLGDTQTPATHAVGFADMLWHGMLHIVTGPDHQAFLIGLVVLSRRLRDLAFVVTGFTLGHSLTLALAVTGVLRPHAEYVDALVGLTIALVGADIFIARSGTARPVVIGLLTLLAAMALGQGLGFSAGLPLLLLLGMTLFAVNYLLLSQHLHNTQALQADRVRMVVTAVFGLVHGFSFAASLIEMQLPPQRLGGLLLGFNLGVEAAQLLLVGVVWTLARQLAPQRWAPSRAVVSDLATLVLTGLGLFWFVVRSHGVA